MKSWVDISLGGLSTLFLAVEKPMVPEHPTADAIAAGANASCGSMIYL